MNAKKTFIKVGKEKLGLFGYEYFDNNKIQNRGTYFLRKNLVENIYTFIAFQNFPFVRYEVNGIEVPRTFTISLWRNIGDVPRYGYNRNEENLENWLENRLPHLMWSVLGVRIYGSPNHVWKYHDEAELILELGDAIDKTIEYGIPWLEDLSSNNPY